MGWQWRTTLCRGKVAWLEVILSCGLPRQVSPGRPYKSVWLFSFPVAQLFSATAYGEAEGDDDTFVLTC